MVQNPWRYTDEEIAHFDKMCTEVGYYYNHAAMACVSKRMLLLILSGKYQLYQEHLLPLNVPLMIAAKSEHITYRGYLGWFCICCQKMPDSIYHCIDLPMIIFDTEPQYLFTQINTGVPCITAAILLAMITCTNGKFDKMLIELVYET